MKTTSLIFLTILLLSICSCNRKDEEPEYIKNYIMDKIFLDEFPTSPEGADTWDNFVGDGPDCKFVLKRGSVHIFTTELQSDLTLGYQQYDEPLPYELNKPAELHTFYLIDQDGNNSDDTMSIINFVPNDYLDQPGFTLTEGETVIDIQGIWR